MEKFFKADWRETHDLVAYMCAVLRAYDEMDGVGLEPGSDRWTVNRVLFLKELRPRVLRHWCEERGRDEAEFPFTDDSVTKTWMDWRKALPEVRRSTRETCFGPSMFSE